ncbi:hypothetical protein BASA81_004170 [Batrachochytrium salamandrivorans]|nr:hypothetical protein BASA81_004170 [Batrachochytrium salamandrivorans]
MTDSPYSTLNVSPGASKEEIRGAFVRVARSIHPDKAGSTQHTNDMYSKVDQAWKVLSDAQMKDSYDSYGEVGPQALQVLRTQMDSKKISRKKLRDALSAAKDARLEEELQTSSSVVCSLKLEDVLNVFSSDERNVRVPPAVLEHLLLEQSSFFVLDSNHIIMFQASAGSARKRQRPILGTFTLGWIMTQGLNSFTSQFAFTALAVQPKRDKHLLPRLTLKGTRQLSKSILAGIEFNGDFNTSMDHPLQPGMQVFCRRQFTTFTESHVFWGIGQMEGVGVTVRHQQSKIFPNRPGINLTKEKRTTKRQFECKLELNAMEGNPSLQTSWTEPLSFASKIKTSITASASNVLVEVERNRVFANRTKVSGAVAIAFPEGIRFKLKLQRGSGVRYEFPIFITSNITLWNAFLTGLIPFAMSVMANRILRPFRLRARTARRERLIQECQAKRMTAKHQRHLMLATAEANKRNKLGLEISHAWFGIRTGEDATMTIESWEEGEEMLPSALDVTVQLNFFLSKQTSTLDLNQGPKSGLLGFYDPSIVRGEDGVWAFDPEDVEEEYDGSGENELFVRYKYQDHMYEITFNEFDKVHLPNPQAVLLPSS